MSTTTAGFIGVGVLLLFFTSGMPIGFVMALVGFLGYVYLVNVQAGLTIMGLAFYTHTASYTLSVIPLFILMGQFATHSGLSRDIYSALHKWIGHLRGGLAMATIAACACFAAICGSSLATAATMTAVALPEMRKYNYSPILSTGSIAAGGTLGVLIPPSITFVVYGMLVEQSVGKLLIAGILPGLLLTSLFILTIYLQVRLAPHLAPLAPKTQLMEKLVALRGTWMVAVLFVVVIGGIYAGVFTPTEAAAVGAFGAFAFAVGKRKLTWQNINSSLDEMGRITGMIFIIIIGGYIYGYFLAVTKLPSALSDFVQGLHVSKYLIFGAVVVLYMILGMFMEGFAILVLTLPIIFPLMLSLGFDPIWFGVIIVILMEMGMISPPVGINVFVVKGIAKDIPMYTIFRGILPFWVAMLFCIFILTVFPQIALFLPNLMKG